VKVILTARALNAVEALHFWFHNVKKCDRMATLPCTARKWVCDVPIVLRIVVHTNVHPYHHVADDAFFNTHHPIRTKTAPSISVIITYQSDQGTDDAWLLHLPLSYHLHLQGALVSDCVRVAGKDVGIDDGVRATGGELSSELHESREGTPGVLGECARLRDAWGPVSHMLPWEFKVTSVRGRQGALHLDATLLSGIEKRIRSDWRTQTATKIRVIKLSTRDSRCPNA
jgi:hypothetical protein